MSDTFAVADPEWIAKVKKGCRLVSRSIYSGFVAYAIALFHLNKLGHWPPRAVLSAIVLGLLTMILIGLWQVTAPPPAMRLVGFNASSRNLARICFAMVPATLVGMALAAIRLGRTGWLWPLFLGSPLGITGLIGVWSFSRYLEQISEVVGDRFTFKMCSRYRRAFAVSWIVMAIGIGGMYWMSAFAPGFLLAAALGLLGVAANLIFTFGLPNYLVKTVSAYGAATEATWRAADTAASKADEVSDDGEM